MLLAAAIARHLAFWVDFFPRNDDLEVDWNHGTTVDDAVNALFGMPVGATDPRIQGERGVELTALLQKLFLDARRIEIQGLLGGRSGAAVMLVTSDGGPPTIVKCGPKGGAPDTMQPPSHENDITNELRRYRSYVHGKIAPYHNVILADAVRETRQLNGFVSSFVGGDVRARIPLEQFAVGNAAQPHVAFDVVRAALHHLVEHVWRYWYDQAGDRTSVSPAAFVKEGFWENDLDWNIRGKPGEPRRQDATELDALVRGSQLHIMGRTTDELASPSKIWKRFTDWSTTAGPVYWSECVGHGDPHGNNLFVDGTSSDVWLIDFGRTGTRNSVFDIAAMEAYIKWQLMPMMLGAVGTRDKSLGDVWSAFAAADLTICSQTTYEQPVIPKRTAITGRFEMGAAPHQTLLDEAMRTIVECRLLLKMVLGQGGATWPTIGSTCCSRRSAIWASGARRTPAARTLVRRWRLNRHGSL